MSDKYVVPAPAGIQIYGHTETKMDTGLRRYDGRLKSNAFPSNVLRNSAAYPYVVVSSEWQAADHRLPIDNVEHIPAPQHGAGIQYVCQ